NPGAGVAFFERERERSVRPQVAVREANFWLLAAAFGLTMAGLSSVLLYQIPLLRDRGMPADRAALVLGATAAMGVVGKLRFGAPATGFVRDLTGRYDAALALVVAGALAATAIVLRVRLPSRLQEAPAST